MTSAVETDSGNYSFWHWKGQADYVDQWFLMSSPYPTLIITVSYLLFVLKVGPELMKNRPPFKLRRILLIYNFTQVIVSIFLFYRGVLVISRYGLFRRYCILDYEDINKYFLSECHMFFMAKITELLDTIFFVLRKKQNQVSFLHVYHHSLLTAASWLTMKYIRTDDLVFGGTINSFIHIVMYAYYGLSVYPQLMPYLWWKKYITTMQLIQFVAVLVYFVIYAFISECPISYVMTAAVFFNIFLFLYLFSDFYRKTYMAKSAEPKSTAPKSKKK